MAFVIMFNLGKKNYLPLNCKTLKKGNFRGKVLLLTLLTLLTLKRSVRNVSSDTSDIQNSRTGIKQLGTVNITNFNDHVF